MQRTAIVQARMNSSRTVTLGWTLALASTAAFSFAPPVARAAIVGGMDSNQLLMLRMLIATSLFGVTSLLTARASLHMPRRAIGWAIASGIVNSAGMILFFLSLNYLEASFSASTIWKRRWGP